MTRLLSHSLVGLVAVVAIGACSSDDGDSNPPATGGAAPYGTGGAFGTGGSTTAMPGTGGASTFGTGGSSTVVTGGSSAMPTGGTTSGVPTGGTTSGVPTGGTTSGVPTGGTTSVIPTGGSTSVIPTGGTTSVIPTGGTTSVIPTGGATSTPTGGATSTPTGGTTSISDGGTPGTGGTTENTGGTTGGDTPTGWWTYGDWHGCVWTGVDDKDVGTTITPQDFLDHESGAPYCASGSVGPEEEYQGVALLGFNLNQDPSGADCSYDPDAATAEGPPGVTLTDAGLAVNIVKQGSDLNFTFRVQIQGPDGATDENQRWCATLTKTQGKIFVPWADFNTKCWDPETGDAYNGSDPISAVVFLVPGTNEESVPFDFCVNGFATGDSEDDAPEGTATEAVETGVLGTNGVVVDRAKVFVGDESYILQNNAWGNGTLEITYTENSFVVSGGSGSNNPAPASFPSIFIGGNGFTAQGELDTRSTDNLPKLISSINSINTKFRWSGTTNSFNATYDVWFANSPPTTEYNDGIDGFMMIWVHDPADAQPIGSDQGDESIANQTWDVWVGPRGDGPEGYNDAPVVSFVARGDVQSMDFDMMEFINKATSYGLSSSMYLTDVFFGFEIWNGGSGGNLSVDEFTCVVN